MPHDTNESHEGSRASEILVAALREAFGSRAIDVAERQHRLASSDEVARTWHLIAEMLRRPPGGGNP